MAKQIIVNTENKSIDVSIEARSNIELIVSRAVSSGVTQINAGNNISVTGISNVTISVVGTVPTAQTVTNAAQPNITSVGTMTGLTSIGNITAPYFIGNVQGNIVGNIVVPGSEGDILFNQGGNAGASSDLNFNDLTNTLTVGGSANVNILNVGEIGTSLVPTSNVTLDLGTANLRWKDLYLAGNTIYLGQSTISTDNGNVIFSGNVVVNEVIGNGYALTDINGANVTGQVAYAAVANSVAGANVSGEVAYAAVANSVAGANVSGQVANATVAGTVYTNAQPNITTVGTLTDLSVAGNATVGNLRSDNLQYANGAPYVFTTNAAGLNTQVQFNDANAFAGSANFTFNKTSNTLTVTNIVGNGSGLTNLNGSNVTGTVANAQHAVVSDSANSVAGANVSGQVANALIAGTVYTNAQPNITSVGTLSGLVVGGNATIGNLESIDSITFDTVNVAPPAVARLSWNDGDGTLDLGLKGGNTTLQIGQETVARVYNDSGVTLVDGDVVYISGAQGNRIAIKKAQANSETTSIGTIGIVTESIAAGAEGFVTNVGTVRGLNTIGLTAGAPIYLSPTVLGGYTTVKPTAPNHIVTLGWVERVHASVGSIYVKVDNGYELDELHNVLITSPTAGQALVYADGPDGLWVNGNPNVANYAGYVTASSQPNITSVGTLISLNVSGDATVTGNLTVTGNTSYSNVTELIVSDPIIQLGGGPNNTPLTSNDGKDRGTLLHYYTTQPVNAFMGWDNSGGEFIFGSNVTIASDVITVGTYGNIHANVVIANISAANVIGTVASASQANVANVANSVSGSNVSGPVAAASTAYSIDGANVSGEVAYAAVANSVAGANVTGQVSYAAVANSVAGANVSGEVANAAHATTANTVVDSAQPNITSTGTLVDLNVNTPNLSSINVNEFAFVSNFGATFNAAGISLSATDGLDILSGGYVYIEAGSSDGLYLNSPVNSIDITGQAGINLTTPGDITQNFNISTNLGNTFSVYSNDTATVDAITAINLQTTGTLNQTFNQSYGTGNILDTQIQDTLTLFGGNAFTIQTGGLLTQSFGSALLSGFYLDVQSSANFNIDPSTTVNLGPVAQVKIQDGTSGQVLSTDGAGNLSWINAGGGGGTPGGADTQLQYNNAGSFGGIATVTYDGANLSLGNIADVKISGGANYQFIKTDGSGNLAFEPITNTLTVGTRSTAVNIGITNYTMNVEARTGNVTVNVN